MTFLIMVSVHFLVLSSESQINSSDGWLFTIFVPEFFFKRTINHMFVYYRVWPFQAFLKRDLVHQYLHIWKFSILIRGKLLVYM